MQSHYAKNNKGCSFKSSVIFRKCTCTKKYINNAIIINLQTTGVRNIVIAKSENWEYEEEFRYFYWMTKGNYHYG